MKLMIGENLRRLRREKDITQEQLAEVLGVSDQSVSRWENDACYPDMELLPTMAKFFETSVDKLLGVDERIEAEKVEEYLSRFQTAINRGDVDACIRIAREGVEEYPNNYVLLNKLMYALFVAGDDDGNIPNWEENRNQYDAEITSLGERIMKYCPDQNIRLEATGRLAFNHCEMGRKKMGRAIYETLPSMECCKENHIWWGLEEEEQLPFIRQKIRNAYEMLSAGLYTLIGAKLLPDEDLVRVSQKYWELANLIYDETYPDDSWMEARLNCHTAEMYVRLGDLPKAIEYLKIATEAAKHFDHRPDHWSGDYLLLGNIEWNRVDFETADSRSLCEIMRDKWLASSEFDCIRDTPDFVDIINLLS